MQPIRLKFLGIVFFIFATTSASANQAVKTNDVLLGAMSPFEDMIEFALAGRDADVSKAIASADRDVANVKKALSPQAASTFATLWSGLRQATADKDRHRVAKSAVEIFRLLSDGLQPDAAHVPKEVSLLDYAGYQLLVIAASRQPDRHAIRKTVDEAAGWWKAIAPKVSDQALRDAFGTLTGGLEQAATTGNLPLLRFAAQVDLDLVDLLERNLKPKR